MNGSRHAFKGRPPVNGSRSGGMLLLALMLMAVTGMLTVSAALFARVALRRVADHRARQSARQAAWNALTREGVRLAAETNDWVSLDQPFSEPAPAGGRQSSQGWVQGPVTGRTDKEPPRLRDAESRINLNTADPPLLAGVLVRGGGLEQAAAEELAAFITDWRTPLEPEPSASPNDDAQVARFNRYRDAGVPWHPPGAPLTCLEELRLMPGGNTLNLDRLADYATVWGSGRVNINTASKEVLRLVFETAAVGLDRGAAERLLARATAAQRRSEDARELTAEALAQWLGPGLPAAESLLLERLLEVRAIDVRSNVFEGTAVGSAPGASGTIYVRIAFAWDREAGRILYWREDGL